MQFGEPARTRRSLNLIHEIGDRKEPEEEQEARQAETEGEEKPDVRLQGGWRQDVRKLMRVKLGDPCGSTEKHRGDRARVGAMKRRNGRGAKAGQED